MSFLTPEVRARGASPSSSSPPTHPAPLRGVRAPHWLALRPPPRGPRELTVRAAPPLQLYCKAWSWIFGIYGVQMLAVPAKMITDHFEAPATPLLTFWVRGQSVSLLGATRASTWGCSMRRA